MSIIATIDFGSINIEDDIFETDIQEKNYHALSDKQKREFIKQYYENKMEPIDPLIIDLYE